MSNEQSTIDENNKKAIQNFFLVREKGTAKETMKKFLFEQALFFAECLADDTGYDRNSVINETTNFRALYNLVDELEDSSPSKTVTDGK